MDGTKQTESPIACILDPFSPEQRRRWRELSQRWRTSVEEVRELPDGYALRIRSDESTIRSAAEWMTLDRLCCPFLTFTLEIEREGGPTWLRLTGRAGAKEFLRLATTER